MLILSLATSRDGSAETVSLVAKPFETCNLHCHSCEIGHYTHYDAYAGSGGEDHSDCHSGTCVTYHSCGGSDDENGDALSVQKALTLLQSGERGSAEALASKYSKTVSINKKFNSVQIMNCTGQVVALIPLTDPGLAVAED